MKNLVVFLAMWVVAMPLYAYFGEPNRDEVRAIFRAYGISLLTAGSMYVTLSLIAVLL